MGGGEERKRGNGSLKPWGGADLRDLGDNQNLNLRGNFRRYDSPICLNVSLFFPKQIHLEEE